MSKLVRINNGFERMSDARLVALANTIHQQVSQHTSHFPEPTPTMAELRAAIDDLISAIASAAAGDRNKIEVRETQKLALADQLHVLGYYVLYASGGNRNIASLSGFPLAKIPTPRGEMPPPGEVRLKLGDQSGVLHARLKKVPGALSYIFEYTTDPTLKEGSWAQKYCSMVKHTFEGLTPGTMYYVRVAAVGRKDAVKYSDIVSKIVG